MKIPKYLQEPCNKPGTVGLDYVARILEVEATLYREGGQREAATALRNTATLLRRIEVGKSPSEVFDWPQSPETQKGDDNGNR